MRVRASDPAHGAPTVPLREPPTSSGTEKNDSQAGTAEGLAFASPPCQCWLERGNVRGDFHGHGHNFRFGLGPRHDVCSARVYKGRRVPTTVGQWQVPCQNSQARPLPISRSLLWSCQSHSKDSKSERGKLGGAYEPTWAFSPTLQAELLEPVSQGVTGDTETLGRLGLISAGFAHRSLDH